ncbi:MAG: DUF1698 domain-containing protein [Pirellulales bacterium]|nr:DUF1698 domain-containing protein [Pirellulales bacterium]
MLAPAAELDDLHEQIARVNWWHQIDLGNGIVTPGRDYSQFKLGQVHLPEQLTGKSVLDVGAWDGFFSFECERRGARRVVALDSAAWQAPTVGKHGFNLARRILNSNVEDVEMEVTEITPESVGTFDVVLFLGVLYHMRHPQLAIDRIAAVTNELLILETHVDLLDIGRPAMAIYPTIEAAGDISNWCGPNAAGVEAMLTMAGFRKVKIMNRQADLPYTVEGAKKRQLGRIVVHAWK